MWNKGYRNEPKHMYNMSDIISICIKQKDIWNDI